MAQTLDNGNTSPIPGDAFQMNQVPYVAPGSAGANQTWNFTSLPAGTAVNIIMVTPASTGHGASFPGSTVAGDAGGGNYIFYTGSATGFEGRGFYSATLGSSVVYQDPERLFAYPCGYNTTWTDNFSANFTSFGTPVQRSGSITGIADGFGTLLMPYGPVTNVLRVKLVEDYSDVLTGIGTIEYDFTTYNFMKPGIRNALLSISDNVTNQLGTPQTSQSAAWQQIANIGIEEALLNAIGIDLYPNPASDNVAVVYSTAGGRLELELIDGTGRLVRSEAITAAMGIGRHDLHVSGLPTGLYQVRITAANGQMGVQRLMVQ